MFMGLFITKSAFYKPKMWHAFPEGYCSRVSDTMMPAGLTKDGKMLQDIWSMRQAFLVSEALTDEEGFNLLS